MFKIILMIALLIISISVAIFMYRAIIGPSAADRIIVMDAIGVNLLAIMAILSIILETYAFFEVILLFGILSFPHMYLFRILFIKAYCFQLS